MPRPEIGSVPFTEAIDYFRNKKLVTTKSWDEMIGDQHARSFTIAGLTEVDVLNDFHKALSDIRQRGGTLNDFRKAFDEIVARSGWTYKGKRGWRTRVIYQTNNNTAAAAGRWQQIVRRQTSLENREPGETLYLAYRVLDNAPNRRPEHQAWKTIILPVGHPWWNTHYPPNGWGCACSVRVYTSRQLERKGLKVTKNPPTINRTERINTRTGEIYPPTPNGIDVGFDHHHGKAQYLPSAKHITNDELGHRVANLTVESIDFEKLATGRTNGTATVGFLPDGLPNLMAVETNSIILTNKTISRQLVRQSQIKLADYKLLPQMIREGLIISQSSQHLVFYINGNRVYRGVLKSKRDGQDLELSEFSISSQEQMNTQRRNGTVIREHL